MQQHNQSYRECIHHHKGKNSDSHNRYIKMSLLEIERIVCVGSNELQQLMFQEKIIAIKTVIKIFIVLTRYFTKLSVELLP